MTMDSPLLLLPASVPRAASPAWAPILTPLRSLMSDERLPDHLLAVEAAAWELARLIKRSVDLVQSGLDANQPPPMKLKQLVFDTAALTTSILTSSSGGDLLSYLVLGLPADLTTLARLRAKAVAVVELCPLQTTAWEDEDAHDLAIDEARTREIWESVKGTRPSSTMKAWKEFLKESKDDAGAEGTPAQKRELQRQSFLLWCHSRNPALLPSGSDYAPSYPASEASAPSSPVTPRSPSSTGFGSVSKRRPKLKTSSSGWSLASSPNLQGEFEVPPLPTGSGGSVASRKQSLGLIGGEAMSPPPPLPSGATGSIADSPEQQYARSPSSSPSYSPVLALAPSPARSDSYGRSTQMAERQVTSHALVRTISQPYPSPPIPTPGGSTPTGPDYFSFRRGSRSTNNSPLQETNPTEMRDEVHASVPASDVAVSTQMTSSPTSSSVDLPSKADESPLMRQQMLLEETPPDESAPSSHGEDADESSGPSTTEDTAKVSPARTRQASVVTTSYLPRRVSGQTPRDVEPVPPLPVAAAPATDSPTTQAAAQRALGHGSRPSVITQRSASATAPLSSSLPAAASSPARSASASTSSPGARKARKPSTSTKPPAGTLGKPGVIGVRLGNEPRRSSEGAALSPKRSASPTRQATTSTSRALVADEESEPEGPVNERMVDNRPLPALMRRIASESADPPIAAAAAATAPVATATATEPSQELRVPSPPVSPLRSGGLMTRSHSDLTTFRTAEKITGTAESDDEDDLGVPPPAKARDRRLSLPLASSPVARPARDPMLAARSMGIPGEFAQPAQQQKKKKGGFARLLRRLFKSKKSKGG